MKTTQGAVIYRGMVPLPYRTGDPRPFFVGINAITRHAVSAQRVKNI